MRVLITGGAGFIGTNLVDYLLQKDDIEHIAVIDKLTGASNTNVPFLATQDDRVEFIYDDIKNMSDYDGDQLGNPDIVVNLAAESHVDRSIEDLPKFFETNVMGTYEVAKWCCKNNKKLIHFSTDEVYGEITDNSPSRFVEHFDEPAPRNPYSTTKLFAEHMIRLAEIEYDMEGNSINIRSCNNFGPYQDHSKFIPVCIGKILTKDVIPLYGSGSQMREWIYVKDTCDVVYSVLKKMFDGEDLPSILNIGSGNDLTNRQMVDSICDKLDVSPEEVIDFVDDPRGHFHDVKYAVDSSLMKSVTGGTLILRHFSDALEVTINWYIGKNYE